MKLDYLQRWRERRLYKQWVKSNALAPQDSPEDITAKSIIPDIDIKQWRLPAIYISIGIVTGVTLTLLILFFIKFC